MSRGMFSLLTFYGVEFKEDTGSSGDLLKPGGCMLVTVSGRGNPRFWNVGTILIFTSYQRMPESCKMSLTKLFLAVRIVFTARSLVPARVLTAFRSAGAATVRAGPFGPPHTQTGLTPCSAVYRAVNLSRFVPARLPGRR